MHVQFDKSINGFQEARRLKMILEHYAHSFDSDKPSRILIEAIIAEIDNFINDPGFESLARDSVASPRAIEELPVSGKLLARLQHILRGISGPTRREMLLSQQRQESLERAERAESMAFEALAETAEIGRERDVLKAQLKALQAD